MSSAERLPTSELFVGGETLAFYDLGALSGTYDVPRLPYVMRILLEGAMRNGHASDIDAIGSWRATDEPSREIFFSPSRVLLHDFATVAIADLAAMREAMERFHGQPADINPQIPVDLVIDHSVQVDTFASPLALLGNKKREIDRNRERYAFLRWGQSAFRNLSVVPPGAGICHQINLEHLASVVESRDGLAFPDTLLGADSHTPMINGLGVLGWGVGGIEAEAAMLGEPLPLLLPKVVGFKFSGELREGTTATDLVLTVTEILREAGVVGKFVEYFGHGLAKLSIADRATIANMSPEYGATCGFFPVDAETIRYLRLTGRTEPHVELVEAYCKANMLWHDPDSDERDYSQIVELDLGTVVPSLAGPRRPQDRIALSDSKQAFNRSLATFELDTAPVSSTTAGLRPERSEIDFDHGSIVVAAITSCTNTSNPSVMMSAGLLARNAVNAGLVSKPWVKTSLAPGSKVVTEYYAHAGLDHYLDQLGFHTVGYGCTTCIGNSGPLAPEVVKQIHDRNLVVCSVLSGNRNFEARIHPEVKANYLASPPLVVAFALAGRIDIDLLNEPIADGVYLRDIWPSSEDVELAIGESVQRNMFARTYASILEGDEDWGRLAVPEGDVFPWQEDSLYVRRPPYFDGMNLELARMEDIDGARCLVLAGDSVTTDHISPAGMIGADSPAGQYLIDYGVALKDFNSYGARRMNHDVMMRGTFANVRMRNQLVPELEGGWTLHLPSEDEMTIFDASRRYLADDVPTIVIAGKEYGTGSSRDWAAKGLSLLGVRAILAESYERIHRSNLLMMGIVPLQFLDGENAKSLGLTGRESYSIHGLAGGRETQVEVSADGKRFAATIRLDTQREREYVRHGGILPYVLRRLVTQRDGSQEALSH